MKSAKIGYWIPTAVLALGFAGAGLGDLLRAPNMAQEIASLGYPAYLMSILGVWKVLAAVALLLPGYAQLKEWAYAGLAFDLTGAAISHLMTGSPVDKVCIPLVFLAIGFASWALRPESRRLSGTFALSAAPSSGRDEALAR